MSASATSGPGPGGPRPEMRGKAQAWEEMVRDTQGQSQERKSQRVGRPGWTLLFIPKLQSILPHPWLHLRLPKLGRVLLRPLAQLPLPHAPPRLSPLLPHAGVLPHVCLPLPWSSVSPASPGPGPPCVCPPSPPGPALSLWPHRPHHHHLAVTRSWATFSNMTHGKGRGWELL